MIALISPAKKLDFNKSLPNLDFQEPEFLDQAEKIMHKLSKQTTSKLGKMMSLSADLAKLNFERNQEWAKVHPFGEAKPALFTFNGDVYLGIEPEDFTTEECLFAQDQLRILSGLYGLLKPLDLIRPYRLEMGTSFSVGRKKNLYQLWQNEIVKTINEGLEQQEEKVLVNLASNEYFKAVDQKQLKHKLVHIEFREEDKNGNFKPIGWSAKRARGLMVRYMVKESIDRVEGLRDFNYLNYSLNPDLSEADSWVFTRPRPSA